MVHMKNLSLTAVIIQIIVGLACIGLGVYYALSDASTHAVVFIVVGAVCIVMAVRTYLRIRKRKKDEEKDKEE